MTDSENETFNQISFVNGIYTSKGGKHVDLIVNQIVEGVDKNYQKEFEKNHILKTIYFYL